MRHPGLVWATLLGSLAVLDLLCDRRHDDTTLSAVTRRAYRTHTLGGRVAFVGSWALLSGWLVPHILAAAEASSPDLHPLDRAVRLLDGLHS